MSVITEADECLKKAKKHLKESYKYILKVLDEDTWGSKDYDEEYLNILEDVLADIRKIKRKI